MPGWKGVEMSDQPTTPDKSLSEVVNDNLELLAEIPRSDGRPSILKSKESASGNSSVVEFDPVGFVKSRGIYNLDGMDVFYLREDLAIEGLPSFSTLKSAMLKLELREMGFESRPRKTENVSEVESIVLASRRHNRIREVGSFGGYFPGEQQIEGLGRALVLDGPNLIQPRNGDFANIDKFLSEFFGNEQLPYFLMWLREAYTSLRDRIRKPGQILLLCGSADAGKGFLQEILLKPLLGGRETDIAPFLFEGDKFNSDLFRSEFLVVEELPGSLKIADREKFGEQLKKLTKGQSGRCRAMHRDGKTISTFRRILISCNPQKVKMLPPLDADLAEATMLFDVKPAEAFFSSFTSRAEAAERVLAEIPALLHHITSVVFPKSLEGRRYGVKSYMNKQLAEEIFEQERWFMLLLLVDRELFPDGSEATSWQGCATDLMLRLQQDGSSVRQSAQKLSSEPAIFGQYLEKISGRYPDRVEKGARRTAKQRAGWIIHPPA